MPVPLVPVPLLPVSEPLVPVPLVPYEPELPVLPEPLVPYEPEVLPDVPLRPLMLPLLPEVPDVPYDPPLEDEPLEPEPLSLFLSQPVTAIAPKASEAAAVRVSNLRMIDPFTLREPLRFADCAAPLPRDMSCCHGMRLRAKAAPVTSATAAASDKPQPRGHWRNEDGDNSKRRARCDCGQCVANVG